MIHRAIQNKLNPYLEHLNLQKRELLHRLEFRKKYKERKHTERLQIQIESINQKIKEYRQARQELTNTP